MTGLRLAILTALCLVATGCASTSSRPGSPPEVTGARPPSESTGTRPQAPAVPAPPAKPAPPRANVQTGKASWYGDAHHGKKTASGEPYDQTQLTAAHRSLPLGTRVRVTNVANGRTVVVRINDRGPFVGGRIIDLSRAAAQELGSLGAGLFPVRLEVLEDAAAEPPAVPR
jgi:rare lipoprotein A